MTYLGRQVILRSKKVLWCSDVSWRETMPEKTLPQFPQVLSIFAKLIFKACCRFNEWQHSLLNPDNILRLTSKLRWAFIWYLYVPPQRCYINKRRLALLFRSCNEQFCLSVLPAFLYRRQGMSMRNQKWRTSIAKSIALSRADNIVLLILKQNISFPGAYSSNPGGLLLKVFKIRWMFLYTKREKKSY